MDIIVVFVDRAGCNCLSGKLPSFEWLLCSPAHHHPQGEKNNKNRSKKTLLLSFPIVFSAFFDPLLSFLVDGWLWISSFWKRDFWEGFKHQNTLNFSPVFSACAMSLKKMARNPASKTGSSSLHFQAWSAITAAPGFWQRVCVDFCVKKMGSLRPSARLHKVETLSDGNGKM